MKFLKSVILTFVTNIVVFGMSIIISVITSRTLGTAGKGTLGLSNNVISLFLIMLDLGVGASNSFFIGKNKKDIRYIAGCNFFITGLECVVVTLLYLISFKVNISIFKGLNTNIIGLTMICIPLSSLKAALINFLLGLQEYKKYNKINIIYQFINLIMLSIFVFKFRSPMWVIVSNIITLTLIVIILSYNIFYKNNIKISFDFSLLKKMINYGIKVQMSNLVQLLTYRLDIFIINYFLTLSDVGIYSNAVTLAETMWQIPGTISTLMYPTIANYDDKNTIRELTNKTMRISFTIIVLCSAVLAVICKPLILFLFGVQFKGSINALLLLIPGICVFSISKILASSIAGMGRVDINLRVSLLSCIIAVVLDLILIPSFGINGASLATSASYIAHAVATVIFYRKLTSSNFVEILVLNKGDINEVKEKFLVVLKRKALPRS